jgi:hypothetical protein
VQLPHLVNGHRIKVQFLVHPRPSVFCDSTVNIGRSD